MTSPLPASGCKALEMKLGSWLLLTGMDCCRMHIFYGQRVVDVPDGKPKWEGLDEKSEKMDLP